jgi:hypothetical protein
MLLADRSRHLCRHRQRHEVPRSVLEIEDSVNVTAALKVPSKG